MSFFGYEEDVVATCCPREDGGGKDGEMRWRRELKLEGHGDGMGVNQILVWDCA